MESLMVVQVARVMRGSEVAGTRPVTVTFNRFAEVSSDQSLSVSYTKQYRRFELEPQCSTLECYHSNLEH